MQVIWIVVLSLYIWGAVVHPRLVCVVRAVTLLCQLHTKQTYMTHVKSLEVACYSNLGLGTHAGGASLSFIEFYECSQTCRTGHAVCMGLTPRHRYIV